MASIDTLISVAEECVGMNLKECVKHFDTSDPGVDLCAWFVSQCGAKAWEQLPEGGGFGFY